jgi:hypothetical protein
MALSSLLFYLSLSTVLRSIRASAPNAAHLRSMTMEDFPIWLKALIYLTVSGTVIYAIAAAIYSNL